MCECVPPLVGTLRQSHQPFKRGVTGAHSAVANSWTCLQSLAIWLGCRRGTRGGVFSVCDFMLPAAAVGWYQKGHPCTCLLDDFSTQALVITRHDGESHWKHC